MQEHELSIHRKPSPSYFRTNDGKSQCYYAWPALTTARRGAIVLLHQSDSSGVAWSNLVDRIDLPEFDFFAWDARGHGSSPCRWTDRPRFSTLLRDLNTFIEHLARRRGCKLRDIFVLAQGDAFAMAAGWAQDYAPPIRGMTFIEPELDAASLRGSLQEARSWLASRAVSGRGRRNMAAHLVGSRRQAESLARCIRARLAWSSAHTIGRCLRRAPGMMQPLQVVVGQRIDKRHLDRLLSGPSCRYRINLVTSARGRPCDQLNAPVLAEMRQFVRQAYRSEEREQGAWQALSSESKQALPVPSIVARLGAVALWLGSQVSVGLALMRARGVDSAITLDHIYRDRAHGRMVIGRLVDRAFLNTIEARAARQRTHNVQAMIAKAIRRLARCDEEIHIVDLAAGFGRYVMDTVSQSPLPVDTVLLRDLRWENVRAGRRLIERKRLHGLVTFDRADAFHAENLLNLRLRPSIAVVSGLYEQLADDAKVQESLEALARTVSDEGFLVYSARIGDEPEVLGQRIRRRGTASSGRSQAAVDHMVGQAGFQKVAQLIDDWGIHTVSLAQRVAPTKLHRRPSRREAPEAV